MYEGTCDRNLSSSGNPHPRTKHHVDRETNCEVIAIFVYPTKMAVIRCADPETPSLERNMKLIGCTICEIFAFKLYCDPETGVRSHSRSSKLALFDRVHTTLYSPFIVNMLDLLPFPRYSRIWSKIATPWYSVPPLGVMPSDLCNNP